jgi:hypothetical protein
VNLLNSVRKSNSLHSEVSRLMQGALWSNCRDRIGDPMYCDIARVRDEVSMTVRLIPNYSLRSGGDIMFEELMKVREDI